MYRDYDAMAEEAARREVELTRADRFIGRLEDDYDQALRQLATLRERVATLIPALDRLVTAAVVAREAIASLPEDALGEGSTGITLADGEADQIVWPIRDELVHDLTKALEQADGALQG